MNPRSALLMIAVMSCLLVSALPAAAQQTIYENGPINGNVDAWTINEGFSISDTFTISGGSSTVNGLSFGAWLSPGDVLISAEVSFSTEVSGGTYYFDQVVNFTASGCTLNSLGYQICDETASFQGPTLNNGTYWLNMENAQTADHDPIYWDENSGVGCHSQGCPSMAASVETGSLPSESFTILGTTQTGTGSTPEPASLALFGSGVAGVMAILRRRRP